MLRLVVFVLSFFCIGVFAMAAESKEEQKVQELEKKVEELQKQLDALKQQRSSPDLEEIQRQVQILAEEIEKIRSGEEETKLEEGKRQSLGLGPSASTVYNKKQGVSFAGYGEAAYENFSDKNGLNQPSNQDDVLDFVRGILYLGYRFNDRFLFNSEVEFEHASTEQGGSVSVEFAHVDYVWNDHTTIRGGLVLIPMGFLNEFHEPTIFLGARRTLTETFLIPSTWRENGAGVLGHGSWYDYRAYVVNGFNAAGFNAEEGLREGKQDGSQARLKWPSFVGRFDVTPTPGLLLGASLYGGNSGLFGAAQEESIRAQVEPDLKIRTVIAEGHVEYKNRGIQLRGLFAGAWLNHVTELNEALGKVGEASVGDRMTGGYLQAGYNIWNAKPDRSLTPYIRYEKLNTQAGIPAGFNKDPETDRTVWTFGMEYHPIFNIVIKADYQAISNREDTGVDQFNLALGYSF